LYTGLNSVVSELLKRTRIIETYIVAS